MYCDWEKLDAELISEYEKDKKAVVKFSNKYGMSTVAIYKRLKKLNIQIRSLSESHIGNNKGNRYAWNGGRFIDEIGG